jgi:hypothetical protein
VPCQQGCGAQQGELGVGLGSAAKVKDVAQRGIGDSGQHGRRRAEEPMRVPPHHKRGGQRDRKHNQADGERVERVNPPVDDRERPVLHRRAVDDPHALNGGKEPIAGGRHLDAVQHAAGFFALEGQAGRCEPIGQGDHHRHQKRWQPRAF